MIRISSNRAPTHPGEMLVEEFLNPMQITQRELATAIHDPLYSESSKKWTMPIRNWKPAMNRFMIEFEERLQDYI